MPICSVRAPNSTVPFNFDTEDDLLGSGTVGSVYRVGVGSTEGQTSHFALKEFLHRAGRDDFANERRVLEALSTVEHEHIMYFLSAWSTPNASYMLFPLADGDLYHFITETPPPAVPAEAGVWLFAQMLGICKALEYVHEHVSLAGDDSLPRRVGFHHDLKPANILLFRSDNGDRATWKIANFGSGAIKYLALDSDETLQNRKASTGDPVYSAPEYIVEGQVSQPKDIWSLGCIFLEVLTWALTPEAGAVNRFRDARNQFRNDTVGKAPMFWCQDSQSKPHVHPAVTRELSFLRSRIDDEIFYRPLLSVVDRMLVVTPENRPSAAELSAQLEALQNAMSHGD